MVYIRQEHFGNLHRASFEGIWISFVGVVNQINICAHYPIGNLHLPTSDGYDRL